MKGIWWFALGPGILALVMAAFVVALLVVKLLWAWTIPDLSPGAVGKGSWPAPSHGSLLSRWHCSSRYWPASRALIVGAGPDYLGEVK